VLIGAELAGVLGALAAIPVGALIVVVTKELLSWPRERMVATTPPGSRSGFRDLASGYPN
jgi:hypothetical protein